MAAASIGVFTTMCGCHSLKDARSPATAARELERIVVSNDGKGFVTEESHVAFRP